MLQYNSRWWMNEQEPKGHINWIDMSKNRPWYKCLTQKTVFADPLGGVYYTDNGGAQGVFEDMFRYYVQRGYEVCIKVSTRTGYLRADTFAIVPYLGQWGRGWIIATHKEGSTVTATYILINGGDPDGIQAAYPDEQTAFTPESQQ